jgi:hypothetical protein
MVSFFDIIGLMTASFSVIDTDEKKNLCFKAMEPIVSLFIRETYHSRYYAHHKRFLKMMELFIRLIETKHITFDLLLKRIENRWKMIEKYYERHYQGYCCEMCSHHDIPMEIMLDEIYMWQCHNDLDDNDNDEDADEDEYEQDFDKIKISLIDDREKKNFYHMKKDIPRHERNKGILLMKNKSSQKSVMKKKSFKKSMKSKRNDFHL